MFLSDPIYQRIYDMITQGSVDTSRQCKPIFTPNNKEENIYRILVLYTLFFYADGLAIYFVTCLSKQ